MGPKLNSKRRALLRSRRGSCTRGMIECAREAPHTAHRSPWPRFIVQGCLQLRATTRLACLAGTSQPGRRTNIRVNTHLHHLGDRPSPSIPNHSLLTGGVLELLELPHCRCWIGPGRAPPCASCCNVAVAAPGVRIGWRWWCQCGAGTGLRLHACPDSQGQGLSRVACVGQALGQCRVPGQFLPIPCTTRHPTAAHTHVCVYVCTHRGRACVPWQRSGGAMQLPRECLA